MPAPLPRRRHGGRKLSGHAPCSRRRALRRRRRTAGGARAAHAPDDRERICTDRASRARRLGDRRRPCGSNSRASAGPRASLSPAQRGDRGGGRLMRRARTISGLRATLEPERGRGRIGLVPTMGALHRGHLELLAAARRECDAVVVSIFVNPAQFDDPDDLASYEPDLEADAQAAEQAGTDVLFVPSVEDMYPEGFQTWVDVEELSRGLEGEA